MSRPLLVVFALLLVLRGWVGDAMAMQPPAAGHCQPAHTAAQKVEGQVAHDGMAWHGGMQDAAPAATHAGSAACGDCQMCHTAALPSGPGGPVPAPLPQALPRATPVAYASADPVPGFKPPIFRSPRP
ncbi:hypothetical protein [Xylophilus ampelinus]|uniref:DUF2946 family protein n=1 Tax=Xylophilus ampelinus TaxID=54067 RepID=A0A318T2N3_9BURK|nr:hypothetical protein [Xylophilus ampelinus]MCS4509102.1 hypothetical protein [Xylophilus ampelinus]PYE79871.1 hypothetical protein DFQ15_101192 [Xylophilus ampelinus]